MVRKLSSFLLLTRRPENGSIIPLLEPAIITSSGAAVAAPVVPYKIVFKPEPTTTSLYEKVDASSLHPAAFQDNGILLHRPCMDAKQCKILSCTS